VAANQWARRRRKCVVHAVSHWLSEACAAGLGVDLTKAIWPTKAMPQGDSCALGAMTAPLCPGTQSPPWIGRDDRSLGAKGERASADLRAGLEATQAFDSDVGFVENAATRQEWGAPGKQRVEHFGLTAVPADPSQPILPRGGWQELFAALAVLASLPGAMDVRERLSVAPLVAPVPRAVPDQPFWAILRSRCSTWWCHWRWWAQRIMLRPPLSPAIAAATALASPSLVWSLVARRAVAEHFELLGLTSCRFDLEWGLQVSVDRNDS
ncbi:unnamed protein product, partial [Prorocentrum cordatum]